MTKQYTVSCRACRFWRDGAEDWAPDYCLSTPVKKWHPVCGWYAWYHDCEKRNKLGDCGLFEKRRTLWQWLFRRRS